MQKKIKNALSQLLKILFSAALIAWLVWSGHLDFSTLTKLLEPAYLIPGLAFTGLSLAMGTERWRRFLHSQKLGIPFLNAFKLNLIGVFFSFAIPGGVGGDLVKGYYITQSSPHAKMNAAVTVFIDRLIGLLAMSLLALALMIYRWDLVNSQGELQFIFYMVALVNLGSFVVWAHIFSHRLNSLGWIEAILKLLPKSDSLIRLYHAVTHYRHSKHVFLPTLLLSLGAQTASVLFFVFAAKALGYGEVPVSTFFVAVPIAFMIQSVPISPGGIGVGQAATFFLYNLLSPGAGPLGAVSTTAYQLAQFFFGLFGAYFYLGISKKLKTSRATRTETEQEA